MKITEGGTGSRHHAKAVGDADYHLPLFSLKVNTLDSIWTMRKILMVFFFYKLNGALYN